MAELKYPKRGFFVAAGIFMILCSIMRLLLYLEPVYYMIEYGGITFDRVWTVCGFALILFVLAIVMMAAKNSIGTIVLLGLITIQNAMWMFDYFESVRYGMNFYTLYSMIAGSLSFISALFITLLALVSRINQKNGFVKAWFVPFILELICFLGTIILFIMNIVNIGNVYVFFSSLINILYANFYTLAIMFFGIGLRAAMNKKPVERVVTGRALNSESTDFRNVREQETAQGIEIPPIAEPVQTEKPLPIAEPVTEKPQEKPPIDDGVMEEIRRYKQLFDDGIITEAEYNRKKSQLLGL